MHIACTETIHVSMYVSRLTMIGWKETFKAGYNHHIIAKEIFCHKSAKRSSKTRDCMRIYNKITCTSNHNPEGIIITRRMQGLWSQASRTYNVLGVGLYPKSSYSWLNIIFLGTILILELQLKYGLKIIIEEPPTLSKP